MNRCLTCLLIFTLVFGFAGVQAQNSDLRLPELLNKVWKATVLIEVGDSFGVGVFVSKEGHIATALHVIQGGSSLSNVSLAQQKIKVKWLAGGCWFERSDDKWPATCLLPITIEHVDREADLALLKVANTDEWKGERDYPYLEPQLFDWPEIGEKIGLLGFPLVGLKVKEKRLVLGPTKEWLFLPGIQSTDRGVIRSDGTAAMSFFWTSMSVSGGFSGGPVFKLSDGKLLGIMIQKNPVGVSYGLVSRITNLRPIYDLYGQE